MVSKNRAARLVLVWSPQRVEYLSATPLRLPIFTKWTLSSSPSSRKICWAGGVVSKEALAMRGGGVQGEK